MKRLSASVSDTVNEIRLQSEKLTLHNYYYHHTFDQVYEPVYASLNNIEEVVFKFSMRRVILHSGVCVPILTASLPLNSVVRATILAHCFTQTYNIVDIVKAYFNATNYAA